MLVDEQTVEEYLSGRCAEVVTLRYVKLNADTTKTEDGGALAMVCCTESGAFMGASTLTIQGPYTPTILEALSCLPWGKI
jgi:hypothetical protein